MYADLNTADNYGDIVLDRAGGGIMFDLSEDTPQERCTTGDFNTVSPVMGTNNSFWIRVGLVRVGRSLNTT
jgi:hypothetical protein